MIANPAITTTDANLHVATTKVALENISTGPAFGVQCPDKEHGRTIGQSLASHELGEGRIETRNGEQGQAAGSNC